MKMKTVGMPAVFFIFFEKTENTYCKTKEELL